MTVHQFPEHIIWSTGGVEDKNIDIEYIRRVTDVRSFITIAE